MKRKDWLPLGIVFICLASVEALEYSNDGIPAAYRDGEGNDWAVLLRDEEGDCSQKEDYCKNEAKCENKGEKHECGCKPGTTGDDCSTVVDCGKPDFCGTEKDVRCTYDAEREKAVCACDEKTKTFDQAEKKCKSTCDPEVKEACKYGGECLGDGEAKFCECKPGTTGDDCSTVVDCGKPDFCGTEKDVKCIYDIKKAKAVCECDEKTKTFDQAEKKCKSTCDPTAKESCKNGGECLGDGEAKFCECKPGTTGDDCSTVVDCGKKDFCGTGKDVKCTYDTENEEAVCKCEDKTKTFDQTENKCKKPCTTKDDCGEKEKCEKGFCQCPEGLGGDGCSEALGCIVLGEICKKTNAVCRFDEAAKDKATCDCKDKKKMYDPDDQICSKKCESDHDCGKKGRCKDDIICKCLPGYGGEDCEELIGCKADFKQKCKEAKATCVHDKQPPYAKCKCTDDSKIYDGDKSECVVEWCINRCGDGAECKFVAQKKTGYCKCKDEQFFYDYSDGTCKEVDPCILRKEPCGKNMVCQEGNCTCAEGFENDNGKCILKCEESECFEGADCKVEGDVKTCKCKSGFYYDGEKCSDGKCFLGDFKNKCDFCPDEFKKDDDKCEIAADRKCKKDCGYGICLTEGEDKEKKETCVCFPSVAELNDKGDRCVLKPIVCASGKLNNDSSKCECTVKQKQAGDKITCEFRTCADKSAQDECKEKRGTCVAVGHSFDCKCPIGFVMDTTNKICTDTCSKENPCRNGEFCYNSEVSEEQTTADCQCPPGLKGSKGVCDEVAMDAFLISNIPVVKKRYQLQNGINHVLLNSDLIQSMKKTFKYFRHGYLHSYESKKDTLNCSVWVQFEHELGVEDSVNQVFFQPSSFKCSGCDSSSTLWPPSVLIDKRGWGDVKPEKLTFCKAKNTLCGVETDCNEETNACFCREGFRILDVVRKTSAYTILRCEDVDECQLGTGTCPDKTDCVNTPGDYHCKCQSGYKKEKDPLLERKIVDKEKCVDLCQPNPCKDGECVTTKTGFDCRCVVGYEGSFCDRKSPSFAEAKKKTAVVGAVLGTLLGITLIAFFLFYWKIKKNSYSEDFEPAPRQNHAAEMMERRPVRGVINQSYE